MQREETETASSIFEIVDQLRENGLNVYMVAAMGHLCYAVGITACHVPVF